VFGLSPDQDVALSLISTRANVVCPEPFAILWHVVHLLFLPMQPQTTSNFTSSSSTAAPSSQNQARTPHFNSAPGHLSFVNCISFCGHCRSCLLWQLCVFSPVSHN